MNNLLLKNIVYLLNMEPDKYADGADGVTLSVNGTLITGKLIPREFFYDAKQNSMLKAIIGPEPKDDSEQNNDDVDLNVQIEKLTLLHLKDAFYVMGSQRIPSTGGIYIAINIDSIDAYSMGDLSFG
ncbi:hypothetical protein EXE25_18115 [Acinetobacter bouvetii]|uniref:Uncharacterized protein n=1 Tax=Acinetobacter bouvetii TaxID=202951 RepID=A0A4Q7APN9_9GAMM|nr:hypothetical protein [Acinetobacter bouvetii]RZG63975.1 hypothetical protein EXE25_18115 [Acinetobacter bouvetii]